MKTTCAPLVEAVEKTLAKLRNDCAIQRDIKQNAFGRRWALSGGSDAGSQKYWDDRQAKAQAEAVDAVAAADKALADFVVESRAVMGADWIGNDHGRLCWDCFSGGTPIGRHYCQLPEGHDGPHRNKAGAWPQNHEALELERRQRERDHVQRVVDEIIAAEPGVEFGEREGPCIVEYRDWWNRGWPMRRCFSCLGCRYNERDAEYRSHYCTHPTFLEKYESRQAVANSSWWRRELGEVHMSSCPVLKERGVQDHCPSIPKDEIAGREPSKVYRRGEEPLTY